MYLFLNPELEKNKTANCDSARDDSCLSVYKTDVSQTVPFGSNFSLCPHLLPTGLLAYLLTYLLTYYLLTLDYLNIIQCVCMYMLCE